MLSLIEVSIANTCTKEFKYYCRILNNALTKLKRLIVGISFVSNDKMSLELSMMFALHLNLNIWTCATINNLLINYFLSMFFF